MLLMACDDGNVTVQNINFDSVTAHNCNDLVYKLNSNEAFIIEITENALAFTNEPTVSNTPKTYQISSANHVVYRFYNGTVATANICSTISPATPSVSEEWIATSGTIEITTTANKSTNSATNGTRITGFNHYIVLRNITFSKPVGEQRYETFVFGNYTTTPTNAMPLGFTTSSFLTKCTSSNVLSNRSGSEALTLDIDPSLIVGTITPVGSPRKGLLSSTSNILTYRLFESIISQPAICSGTLPTILEEWNAVDGVMDVSGIVEVTTVSNGSGFLHSIHLKGVTLKKGTSDFYLADDYYLGDYLSN